MNQSLISSIMFGWSIVVLISGMSLIGWRLKLLFSFPSFLHHYQCHFILTPTSRDWRQWIERALKEQWKWKVCTRSQTWCSPCVSGRSVLTRVEVKTQSWYIWFTLVQPELILSVCEHRDVYNDRLVRITLQIYLKYYYHHPIKMRPLWLE